VEWYLGSTWQAVMLWFCVHHRRGSDAFSSALEPAEVRLLMPYIMGLLGEFNDSNVLATARQLFTVRITFSSNSPQVYHVHAAPILCTTQPRLLTIGDLGLPRTVALQHCTDCVLRNRLCLWQGISNGMPVEADIRGVVYNMAIASGEPASYDTMQQLYMEVRACT
jgi:hypothetical protein